MTSSTVTEAARLQLTTRTVEGAWAGGTWIDAGVLAHAWRSAQGGFDFTVRSTRVADALVTHGLATRVSGRTLRGTAAVQEPVAQEPVVVPSPRRPHPSENSQVREVTGWCASSHHVTPVAAVVAGRRARHADDAHGEAVRLCARCADLLGDAGFFRAA